MIGIPTSLPLTLRQRLLPKHCALLAIDMQNDFCAQGGYVETVVGKDAAACRAVVPAIEALAEDARTLSIPVFWVTADYTPETIPASMRVKQLEKGEAACCARGSWGAEFFGVSQKPADRIVVKHTYSAFRDTPLAEDLRAAGVRTIIFAGVQTNVCVDNSVRDAFCLGFHCVVVEDCVASHTQPLHEAALTNIRFLYGDVIDKAQLLDIVRASDEAPQ